MSQSFLEEVEAEIKAEQEASPEYRAAVVRRRIGLLLVGIVVLGALAAIGIAISLII